jgi:outer membrane protein
MRYIFTFILIFGTTFANSQSYAYIDSDYILSKVPEYVEAKDKLDKLAERWTKEIEDRYTAIKKKKKTTSNEKRSFCQKKKRKNDKKKLKT